MVVLVACGSSAERPPDAHVRPTGQELHEKVDCSDAWSADFTCEVPCADELRPAVSRGTACSATAPAANGGTIQWGCAADALFTWRGVMGCCARAGIGDEKTVYFVVCDGQ